MKGPTILWIIGLIGMIYIILYHAIDFYSFEEIQIGAFKINFIFEIGLSIAISAVTSFIIGAVYEYVIKYKEGKELTESLKKNNEAILEKVPLIAINFDTFWNALDPTSVKKHLLKILNQLTKNEIVSRQFLKAISSVEDVSTNIWGQLSHNVVIGIEEENESVLSLRNTVSFRDNILLKKNEKKIMYFVMVANKDDLQLFTNKQYEIEHYWISKVGFDIVKKKLDDGKTEYGYPNVEVAIQNEEVILKEQKFQREIDIENEFDNKLLVWSLCYTPTESGEFSIDYMYIISTFTGGDNPFFYVFLEKAATSLNITVHSTTPNISILKPKLFLRPDQKPITACNKNEASVIVNDVLLPGHGVLFLFDKK